MTIRETVIQCIADYPGRTTDEVASLLGMELSSVACALQGARKHAHIYCQRQGQVHVWFENGYTPERVVAQRAEPNRMSRMEGYYTCPELRVAPVRPGAMDAYKLKSRGIG